MTGSDLDGDAPMTAGAVAAAIALLESWLAAQDGESA